jgi:hypothetical protein
MTRTCAACKHVRTSGVICKKGNYIDARGDRKECKDWKKQDCINCQFMCKDASEFYYKSYHKLWWTGRGNPATGERCDGCELREFVVVKGLIEQVKRDASDLYETIGSINCEHVSGRDELVSLLELVAETMSTSASKAGELGLKAREVERTGDSMLASLTRTLTTMIMSRNTELISQESNY